MLCGYATMRSMPPIPSPRYIFAINSASAARPAAPKIMVKLAQLRRELEQPRETIRALETRALRGVGVPDLTRDPLGREAPVQRRHGPRRERPVDAARETAHHAPVPVHRRVPVERAEERGCELPRRPRVGVAQHHVLE